MASLPKNAEVETLTMEEAVALLAAKAGKSGKAPARAAKASAEKTAPAKKPAAKTTAAKKAKPAAKKAAPKPAPDDTAATPRAPRRAAGRSGGAPHRPGRQERSEERRVGKECDSTGRSWRSPSPSTKNYKKKKT